MEAALFAREVQEEWLELRKKSKTLSQCSATAAAGLGMFPVWQSGPFGRALLSSHPGQTLSFYR